MFFEFTFKVFKQGKGIGGASGEARDDLVVIEATHLAGIAFHDGIAKGHLAVGADDDLIIAAYGQYGCATVLIQCVILLNFSVPVYQGCAKGQPLYTDRWRKFQSGGSLGLGNAALLVATGLRITGWQGGKWVRQVKTLYVVYTAFFEQFQCFGIFYKFGNGFFAE